MIWKLEDVWLLSSRGERLSNVTLEIGEGVTAVVGCSGAGKTSLLNLLVGFERPSFHPGRGEIVFSPPDAKAGNAPPVRQAQGDAVSSSCRTAPLPLFWVPQEGGLWPHMTARQHLEAVAPPGPGHRGASSSEIADILSSLDIGGKTESYPDEMSLGEQSRLSVARAIASRAQVLVMDEPLSNVDEASRPRYWDAIREHLSETGASLVFATHSPKPVLREAKEVICLREGRVIYSGGAHDLYHRPATRELMHCLGEGNWLEPAESRLWLGLDIEEGEKAARCYRPEQIEIEVERAFAAPKGLRPRRRPEGSPITVRRSSFQGSVAEVELEHEGSHEVKRFYHRPSSNSLRPGDRVVLKVLLALLLVSLVSCGKSDEPELRLSHVRAWMLPPDGTRIPAPRAVAVRPEGGLVVLDTAGRVLIYDRGRELVAQWRMPETEAGNPEAALVLLDGRIAVADTHYHRVLIFDPPRRASDEVYPLGRGRQEREIGREGRGPGEFIYPVALAQDHAGNLYVCEYGSNDRVQKFSAQGELIERYGQHGASFGSFGTGEAQFQRPSDIVWHEGRLFIADAINNRILVFSDDGEFIEILGSPEPPSLHFPYDLALGPEGALYIIEYGACRITKVSPSGELLGRYGRVGSGGAEFATPWGIAVDSRGRIVVADTGNRRIVELEP